MKGEPASSVREPSTPTRKAETVLRELSRQANANAQTQVRALLLSLGMRQVDFLPDHTEVQDGATLLPSRNFDPSR